VLWRTVAKLSTYATSLCPFRPEADPQVSPDVARQRTLIQQASPNASLVYRHRAEWFNLPDHYERFKAADMLVG
jgi:hypothetical protein